MGDVITLPRRESATLVWRCVCGCMSYFARSDGELECASCGLLADAPAGGWRVHLPEPEDEVPESEIGSTTVVELASEAAALRRTIGRIEAGSDNVVRLIAMWRDDTVTTWGAYFETDEDRAWFDHLIAGARRGFDRP